MENEFEAVIDKNDMQENENNLENSLNEKGDAPVEEHRHEEVGHEEGMGYEHELKIVKDDENDFDDTEEVPIECTREERDLMQTNRSVILHGKLHKVDESYAFALSLINIIRNQQTEGYDHDCDINVQINELDAQETNMFSDAPPFLKDVIVNVKSQIKEAKKREACAEKSSEERAPNLQSQKLHEFKLTRAYVNPRAPLRLPFNAEKYFAEDVKKNTAVGAYHELFFGDPSNVHFVPPPDNPRKRVEKVIKSRSLHRNKSAPPSYEPEFKPNCFTVTPDFVPACALRYDQYWRRRKYERQAVNSTTTDADGCESK